MDKPNRLGSIAFRLKDLFFGSGVESLKSVQEKPDFDALERRFLQKYRELAAEIASHREYEREIAETVGEKAGVNKRFDPEEYKLRLLKELERLGLFRHACENTRPMRVFLQVLAPPEEAGAAISKELRKQFFGAVLLAVAERCRVPLPDLLKGQYEFLKHNDPGLSQATQKELLELFRESLVALPVDQGVVDTGSEETEPEELEAAAGLTEQQARNLLWGIFNAAGLKRQREVRRLFEGGSLLPRWGSLLFKLALLIVVLSLRSLVVGYLQTLGSLEGTLLPGLLPDIVVVLLAVSATVDSSRLTRERGRKRVIKRGVAALVRELPISVAQVERFVHDSFSVDPTAVRRLLESRLRKR
jgi:hypothetical protein